MDELVPIQVKVNHGRANGSVFPPLNDIPSELRGNMGWSEYIDKFGSGFIANDRVSNLGKGGSEGKWVALVPKEFADAAVSQFPDDVSTMNETQLSDFWDTRYGFEETDEIHDTDILQGLAAKKQLKGANSLTDEDRKAIDPLSPVRGIRKNPRKTWARMKENLGLSLHPDFV